MRTYAGVVGIVVQFFHWAFTRHATLTIHFDTNETVYCCAVCGDGKEYLKSMKGSGYVK